MKHPPHQHVHTSQHVYHGAVSSQAEVIDMQLYPDSNICSYVSQLAFASSIRAPHQVWQHAYALLHMHFIIWW